MDATLQVALIGIFTTVITTAGVVVTAIINNKRERGSAAESAMERTLRERILLRDEQIAELKADVEERDKTITLRNEKIAGLKNDIAERDRTIMKFIDASARRGSDPHG